jgi:hypothetical protein
VGSPAADGIDTLIHGLGLISVSGVLRCLTSWPGSTHMGQGLWWNHLPVYTVNLCILDRRKRSLHGEGISLVCAYRKRDHVYLLET